MIFSLCSTKKTIFFKKEKKYEIFNLIFRYTVGNSPSTAPSSTVCGWRTKENAFSFKVIMEKGCQPYRFHHITTNWSIPNNTHIYRIYFVAFNKSTLCFPLSSIELRSIFIFFLFFFFKTSIRKPDNLMPVDTCQEKCIFLK